MAEETATVICALDTDEKAKALCFGGHGQMKTIHVVHLEAFTAGWLAAWPKNKARPTDA